MFNFSTATTPPPLKNVSPVSYTYCALNLKIDLICEVEKMLTETVGASGDLRRN